MAEVKDGDIELVKSGNDVLVTVKVSATVSTDKNDKEVVEKLDNCINVMHVAAAALRHEIQQCAATVEADAKIAELTAVKNRAIPMIK